MSDPLQIICKNCGAAAEYKIEQQSYVYTYCGEVSGIKEACDSVTEWRELQKDSIEAVWRCLAAAPAARQLYLRRAKQVKNATSAEARWYAAGLKTQTASLK